MSTRHLYAEREQCGVDGCETPLGLFMLGLSQAEYGEDGHAQWRVQHGPNPEHSRIFPFTELFITTGYTPWVREVHAREAHS